MMCLLDDLQWPELRFDLCQLRSCQRSPPALLQCHEGGPNGEAIPAHSHSSKIPIPIYTAKVNQIEHFFVNELRRQINVFRTTKYPYY